MGGEGGGKRWSKGYRRRLLDRRGRDEGFLISCPLLPLDKLPSP